jgi:ATP-dependent RNA helicase RhlE
VNPAEEYHFARIQEIIRREVTVANIPQEVDQSPTPFAEKQAYEREIDNQKRKADPDFKGAFHEKKSFPKPPFLKEKPKGNKHSKAKRNRNQMKKKGGKR